MIKIEKDHLHSVARLLVECFADDELVTKQTKGIENKEEFLKKLFLLQVPILHRTYEMNSLDESIDSVIVGYEKKKFKPFQELLLSILSQFRFNDCMDKNDLKKFIHNSKEAVKCLDLKWQKKFIKGNYYYIKVIAIAKNCRGKGKFRAMIMPIIDYCKEKNIPIILETNTPENVPIYQHFGFELVKTIREKDTDFCQYCFIKRNNIMDCA